MKDVDRNRILNVHVERIFMQFRDADSIMMRTRHFINAITSEQ